VNCSYSHFAGTQDEEGRIAPRPVAQIVLR
jgi:hypothetical protein